VSFHRRAVLRLLLAAATVLSSPLPAQAQSASFFPQATDAAAFYAAIPSP